MSARAYQLAINRYFKGWSARLVVAIDAVLGENHCFFAWREDCKKTTGRGNAGN